MGAVGVEEVVGRREECGAVHVYGQGQCTFPHGDLPLLSPCLWRELDLLEGHKHYRYPCHSKRIEIVRGNLTSFLSVHAIEVGAGEEALSIG